MRVLVAGCRGMLGQDVMALLEARGGCRVDGFDLPEVDIRDAAAVACRLKAHRAAALVNCAAYTDVDGCETDPDTAHAVNGEGARVLACCCRDAGARMVHVSTDFVFSGKKAGAYTEDDAPDPLNAYGRSKLAGERFVRQAGGAWLIARTAWLYGHGGKNFVATILGAARAGKPLRVVNDQRGCPTYTRDLAAAIAALLEAGAGGVVHTVNVGSCTWHELASAAVELAGVPCRVATMSSAELGRPARRPASAVLDTGRLRSLLGRPLRPWREALAEYVGEMK